MMSGGLADVMTNRKRIVKAIKVAGCVNGWR
jgi:hypothetical protein